MAGIWGWQQRPTLFWNRLLISAARGSSPEPNLIIRRSRSRRNYISADEAARCLLRVGLDGIPGLFLAAGHETLDTQSFVQALRELPGSKLTVEWQDDGLDDEIVYLPSRELLGELNSFTDNLSATWANRPQWIAQKT